ncbi:DUF1499 domain-containing protein [Indioceanicola profundi]|uniref:DUF1499 domain-containing protein n=1 Tax=Indioceanicola profundi TaxID=2220096 RepID=UPI0013C44E4F|nr:DUF1499 domain-containing protein [Indioceanicola profundi]
MELAGKILAGTAVTLLTLFIAWQIFIAFRIGALEREYGGLLDFSNFQLSWKPNQHLLAPAGATAASAHGEAPLFAVAPEKLRDALLAVVEGEPRTRIVSRSGDSMAFTAVQQTALMRFPDFVSMEIRPVDGGSMLLVYSRAVFGVRDFGVNQKRVEDWIARVRARL